MHRIEQAECLDRAVAQVALVALERRAAANIDVPQVEGRISVDDPVREHLARPTGRLDADRIEASRDVHAAHLRRLAQEITVVGSETFRPVEEHLHTG